MSRKLWVFAILLMSAGGFVFSLGYYAGKRNGIAEMTEIILAEKFAEQNKIDKAITDADL